MLDFLPIGSVVSLKNATKKLMVCGRVQADQNASTRKLYHYSGCLYPEGILDPNKIFLFNNEDIETIYYIGMQDGEEFSFRKYILDKIKETNTDPFK